MKALAKATYDRFFRPQQPHAEPEAAFAKPRPMTGFFANLTDDQKKKALTYKGPENFGDPHFKLEQSH